MRAQTLASIVAARTPRTIADVTRTASARSVARRYFDEFDDAPTIVRADRAYTASERAWFRRPLGAMILAIALACGGSAQAAPHESKAVASARAEVTTARAHLKAARATERARVKATHNAAKVAKLRKALAKASITASGYVQCDGSDPSCTDEYSEPREETPVQATHGSTVTITPTTITDCQDY